ncbi:MAG: TonB-dependent receptor [Pseudomonadota bacterium]
MSKSLWASRPHWLGGTAIAAIIAAASPANAETASSDAVALEELDTALAQTNSEEPEPLQDRDRDDDDVVIVTGTKTFQSIQKTEASVAVITEKSIEEQALFDLRDALLRTANVSTLGGDAINQLSIRGVQLGGVGNAGTGATAQVYVDGAPASFNANQGVSNLWDVAQVEILRGPQSTVQGRNALSGAVVINTADPEYDFGARVRGIVGTQDTYQISGMVTGPIVSDQVAFRIAADYRENDFGVIDQTSGQRAQFIEALTLRGKLLFEPEFAEGLRLELIASYADTSFGQFNILQSPVPVDDPAFADFDIFGSETFPAASRLEFNEVIRGIADLSYDISDTWSINALATVEDVNRTIDFAPAGAGDNFDRTYSGELRANFNYGDVTGWIGGYYFDTNTTSDTSFITPLSLIGLPVDPPDSVVDLAILQGSATENFAIFGDINWDISDKWTINIGARYDWETFSSIGLQGSVTVDPPTCTVSPVVPFIGGLPCVNIIPVTSEPPLETNFEAFLPRAAITYNISDDVSIAATVARGYRAGGAVFFAPPGATPTLLEFGPEFLTNYEIAFRSQFWDQRITLNANFFYSTWDDQQVSIPDPSGLPFSAQTLNAGQSELYGAEIDLLIEIVPEFDVFASVGLLSTEFVDFPFAQDADGNPLNPDFPQFANLAGNSFPGAPEFNLSFGFNYTSDSGFFVNANGAFSTEQFSEVANLPENLGDPIMLVNGRIGYRSDNWEIAIFANNLFNERALTRPLVSTVDPATGTPTLNDQPSFTSTDRSVIGISLGWRL